MVVIENLKKNFGKNKVLNGVNLTIEGAGIFAILGPNGSGKTTLIKSILGMTLPDSGHISVLGQGLNRASHYREQITYLPQIANFPNNLTVQELIGMIKDLRQHDSTEDVLIEAFALQPFLNKKLGTLSGGTKQKVNLVLTFMFDAPLIILDEPTSGLDPIALITLKQRIQMEKARGKTILITSHIMSFVEVISDEIVFLLEGVIYFKGSIEQLKKTTQQSDFEHAIAKILTQNNV